MGHLYEQYLGPVLFLIGRSPDAFKLLLLITPLTAVGCLNEADSDRGDVPLTNQPLGYESGSDTISQGAESKTRSLGTEYGDGSPLSGFPSGTPENVREPIDVQANQFEACVDNCRDEGYGRDECEDACENGDPYPMEEEPSDPCAGLESDACLLCLCQNPDDTDVCMSDCAE